MGGCGLYSNQSDEVYIDECRNFVFIIIII